MKLAISNIAWSEENSMEIYEFIKAARFSGIEIAPTKIWGKQPYENIMEAKNWAEMLKSEYNLSVASIQSIWNGIELNLFGTSKDRKFLLEYTKRIIDFAEGLECNNIVFGCPRNRVISSMEDSKLAVDFFRQLDEYIGEKQTIISIEANPPIYNTNFINTTSEAFEFCRRLNCEHIKVNLDIGTVIYNREKLSAIKENMDIVNHIHISEPYLEIIKQRDIHKAIAKFDFENYVSIEMKAVENIQKIKEVINYFKEVFSVS